MKDIVTRCDKCKKILTMETEGINKPKVTVCSKITVGENKREGYCLLEKGHFYEIDRKVEQSYCHGCYILKLEEQLLKVKKIINSAKDKQNGN